jgi:hypothetical protein
LNPQTAIMEWVERYSRIVEEVEPGPSLKVEIRR